MDLIKKTDLAVQGILGTAGILYGTTGFFRPQENVLLFYYLLGGWQLAGFLYHRFNPSLLQLPRERKWYGLAVLLLALLLLILLGLTWLYNGVLYLLVLYLYALLWISPVLAACYFLLCYREIRLLNKKAFIHLKN